ncbi:MULTISPECIES: hypothetical protein [unclassified Thiomonas]|jgi:hypothetical protein|uniref:hypothetical protein n=1 Tax=unclassified Thiomonas TaxID=2625466 RepID=UPI0004DBC6C9|nr:MULTISPECIES: hypothetical protein [unclassified Thiomonas]CDW94980.1 hypothetical protein THICB2_590116 [Thiomonas sp. CB2]VDY03945.1 protein of unknown function [Thiomonas sp. Bio17B3]VDY08884.1 protein of unknown function [Thiomonas sp. Sup16B3]VDY12192.1 conserved protein of unknown function [Thiomonas sp. OC7]VDY18594.1 protein of unknown function [Thiomonas sp. CB2]
MKSDRDAALVLRREAIAEKTAVDARLFDIHRIACDQFALPEAREAVRRRAQLQVDRWERGHLCSPRYIAAWKRILGLEPKDFQAEVLRTDAEGVALRQNTPFGFLAR